MRGVWSGTWAGGGAHPKEEVPTSGPKGVEEVAGEGEGLSGGCQETPRPL